MAKRKQVVTDRLLDAVIRFVNWLSDRLFGPLQIKRKVVTRFGPQAEAPAKDAIKDYQQSRDRAEIIKKAPPSAQIPDLLKKDIKKGKTTARYHIRFPFDNPKTGEKEDRGYIIDLPITSSKRELREKIRQMIIDMLAGAQSLGLPTAADISKRIGRITITRVEVL